MMHLTDSNLALALLVTAWDLGLAVWLMRKVRARARRAHLMARLEAR